MAKISPWIDNIFLHLQMKTFSHFNFCHSRWNSFCWAERNSSCPLATHCKLTKHFGTMKLQYITPCESQMLCRWPQHNRRGNIQCPQKFLGLLYFLILFAIDEIYLGYYFWFILHTYFDPRLDYTIMTNYLIWTHVKSVNLQFNTVWRRDDDMIVPPSDGPMIIWIDWK